MTNIGLVFENLGQTGREIILATAARYGARNVRFFGSVARGEANERSDLNLLVDLDTGRTLMDLGGLLMDIEAQLCIRVDVAAERILREDIRDRVLSEDIRL